MRLFPLLPYVALQDASGLTGIDIGTADFLVTHIHAFTLSTTVLVLVKGVVYSRSSRLVADKFNLGFRYPCDGPGRGGTCQISSWDHVFLGLFWMYNCISIVIFHYSWKLRAIWQSNNDILSKNMLNDDFTLSSISVGGWLRSFLWSGSATVIQSSGTNLAGYGCTFLLCYSSELIISST
jgi:photosystem I P700 chlorophyll a apoprotein A1